MNANQLHDHNVDTVYTIEQTLEQVWNGSLSEDKAADILSNEVAIEDYIDATVERNLTASLVKGQSALDLVLTALKLYFATGDVKRLTAYRKRIAERATGYKNDPNTRHYVSILADFMKGVKNGLGELCRTDRVAKNGDALYVVRESMRCAYFEKGEFHEVSATARKKVRHRFCHDLQWVNLVKPRLYTEAKEKKSIDQIADRLRAIAKEFDTPSQDLFNSMITWTESVLAELRERAADKKAAA